MIRQKKITVKTLIEVLKQKDPQERHEKLLDDCVKYGETDHGRKNRDREIQKSRESGGGKGVAAP